MVKRFIFACFCFSSAVFAQTTVTITPDDLQDWQASEVGTAASVEINATQAFNGNGSIMFSTTQSAGQDGASFGWTWQGQTPVIAYPDRTLGNLNQLAYQWYRNSASTAQAEYAPALVIGFYSDNGTPGVISSGDDVIGALVWSPRYNGVSTAPTDSWQSNDALNGIFWVRVLYRFDGGTTGDIQNYNSTLSDWMNNSPQGQPGDPEVNLSASTYLVGVGSSVGPDWGGDLIAHVDSIRLGFNSEFDRLFNFEAGDVIFANGFEAP